MLIALLLQASIAAQPPAEQPRPQRPAVQYSNPANPACRAQIIEAMAPAMGDRALAGYAKRLALADHGKSVKLDVRPWIPAENPEAGFYAAVERQVDGCSVPTPIFLPNAQDSKPAE